MLLPLLSQLSQLIGMLPPLLSQHTATAKLTRKQMPFSTPFWAVESIQNLQRPPAAFGDALPGHEPPTVPIPTTLDGMVEEG